MRIQQGMQYIFIQIKDIIKKHAIYFNNYDEDPRLEDNVLWNNYLLW